MRTHDLEAHHGVIEGRWLPGHGRVAVLAGLRQVQRNVIYRTDGLLEIRQVASYARDARELRVIERRSRPTIDVVAKRTIRRKLTRYVVGSFGLLKPLSMAAIAIRGEPLELPRCRTLVTRIAVHHRVRANQRKTVLVILNRADVRLPALDRVAGFAVGAHLPAMNIRMAVRAFTPNIRKHRLGVTRRARHIGVHATQRVLRLTVIKFRDRADRLPSRLRVTVLAGNYQGTVRAPRAVARRASASPSGRSGHHGRQPQKQNS